jgi:damage-control phosphatase, subfamily III
MASLALDFDSPNFEYFPPTPSPSDDESELKSRTAKLSAMSSSAPDSLPAAASNGDAAPTANVKTAKVTLHLGHLPSKKDIKGPWPRTPTRVSPSLSYIIFH